MPRKTQADLDAENAKWLEEGKRTRAAMRAREADTAEPAPPPAAVPPIRRRRLPPEPSRDSVEDDSYLPPEPPPVPMQAAPRKARRQARRRPPVEKASITIRSSAAWLDRVQQYASARGLHAAELIRVAVAAYLDGVERGDGGFR